MTKINLSPEELTTIQQCINDNVEIPLDIMQKLNPSFFDKLAQDSRFNFEKLNRYKIPTIEYAGKRSESTILASATLLGQSSPLQVERLFEGGKMKTDGELQMELYSDKNKDGNMDVEDKDKWMNMIVQGDNLQFLKTCYLNQDPLIKDKVKGKVKLIYIDPPFATKGDFGGSEGESSYSDGLIKAEFIENIRERIIYLKELLTKDGSLFVHLDWRMHHNIRVILDEVFGKDFFINEIIWRRRTSKTSPDTNRMENVVDYILWYSYGKSFELPYTQYGSEEYIKNSFKLKDENGRFYQSTALNAPKPRPTLRYEFMGYNPPENGWSISMDVMERYFKEGKLILPKSKTGRIRRKQYLDEWPGYAVNSLWLDIPVIASQAKERLEYPTQKPEALLERIVSIASQPGDLIMDCFGGSGTTGAVSEKLNRRWILCDFGKHAIYTMQKRLLTIKTSKKLGTGVKLDEAFGKNANPFAIVSVGAFDFSKILDLRKHKTAYVNFVLELNGIHERDTSRYSIPNIFGIRNGNPVEVFPIWEDEYLKDIKIDIDYLQGIIQSSGGKLKGDYYIIAPEICDVVGDTQLSNQNGGTVNFKLLTFPYKILEEVSRHYQLSEQPSDGGDINNLISSTRFYFNEEVKFKAELVKDGLIIKEFETNITDKDGNKFNNLDGLAMVLIDKDWDGNLFTMEESVYLKDIPQDPAKPDFGFIKITELTNKVALIAIDKHGNESKITIIEK